MNKENYLWREIFVFVFLKTNSIILRDIALLQLLELGPKTYKSPRFLQLYGKLEQALAEMSHLEIQNMITLLSIYKILFIKNHRKHEKFEKLWFYPLHCCLGRELHEHCPHLPESCDRDEIHRNLVYTKKKINITCIQMIRPCKVCQCNI